MILIVGPHPLYRLAVADLIQQQLNPPPVEQVERLEQLPREHLSKAQALVLCNPALELAQLDDQLQEMGCPFTTLRILLTEPLGKQHRRLLAEGCVDLILPLSIDLDCAGEYLDRLLNQLEPELGFQVFQDPRLIECFHPDLNDLTQQELRVLSHISQGLSNRAIAQRMAITINTVKVHFSHACKKTGISNRTQAVKFFNRHTLAAI